MLLTVRAPSMVWSCMILLHRIGDTAAALENKVVLTNFGDQMLPRSAVTDAALVVGIDTTLTVDQRCKVSAVLT